MDNCQGNEVHAQPVMQAMDCETHLLDLPDDILGKLYAKFGGDTKSKAALRHSCTALLMAQPGSLSRDCELQCDVQGASFLPDLFPRLHTLRLHTTSGLPADSCSIFEALTTCQHLRYLAVYTTIATAEKIVEFIGQAKKLQSLEVNIFGSGDVDIAGLSGLQELKELHLNSFPILQGERSQTGVMAINLHLVLSDIPLHHLHLMGVEMPLGVHYASTTVQSIHVESMSLAFPALAAHNFPSLKMFRFGGLNFSGLMFNFSAEQLVQEAADLVAWIVRLPSVACEWEDEKSIWTGDRQSFVLAVDHGLPARQCTSLLVQLIPLKPMLSAIQQLEIRYWHFQSEGISILGALFNSADSSLFRENVTALKCNCCQLENNRGVLDILQALPLTRTLELHGLQQMPFDIIAALFFAQHTSRSVHLEVVLDRNIHDYDRASEGVAQHLSEQWKSLLANMSEPQHADFNLRVVEEDGNSE
eukprot:1154568-Pelagomonas_calceolata.AAC.10